MDKQAYILWDSNRAPNIIFSPKSNTGIGICLNKLSHHHTLNSYHSQIHKKDIILNEFATFLQDECKDVQEVHKSYYVNKYKEGITKVVDGEKL